MKNKQRVATLVGLLLLCYICVFIFANSLVSGGKEITKNKYVDFDAVVSSKGYERETDHFTLTDKKEHYVTFERDYSADEFSIVSRVKPEKDLKIHLWFMDYSGYVYDEYDAVWKKGENIFTLEKLGNYISLISISVDQDFDAYMTISCNYVDGYSVKIITLIVCFVLTIIVIVLYMLKKLNEFLDWIGTKAKRCLVRIKNNYKILLGILVCAIMTPAVLYALSQFDLLDFNWKTLLVCFCSLVLVFITVCTKKLRKRPHVYAASVVLIVGTMFSFVEPSSLGVSWDDEIHYFRALNLSHIIDQKEYLVNDAFYYNYSRVVSDQYTYSKETEKEAKEFYDALYENKYYKSFNSFSIGVDKLVYLPYALGLTIARGMGLPFNICIMFGRWFSIILYAMLVYFAIKKLKYGKVLIALIALIPTNIFLASSFSYDTWVTAWTILGLSYVFSEMQTRDEYITKKSIAVITVSFFLASIAKQIYFVMAIMAIFLSKVKFERKIKKWVYRGLVVLSMVLPFVLMFFQRMVNVGGGDTRGGSGVNPSQQIAYITSHFGDFLNTLIDFLKVYLNPVECHRVGNCYLDALAYNGVMNIYWIILLVILIGAFINHGDVKGSFPIWYRAGVLLMYVGVGALCATALYIDFTPVGVDYIGGCQGRYIIPMLFPLIFVFSRISKKQVLIEKFGEERINSLLIGIMVVLNVYCLVQGCVLAY